MDSKTNAAPSFTVSLRGYDRMEVDEYLDSLAEALGQVEQAEDRCRVLQSHLDRQNARIAELEERISTEAPRSGVVLGERIAILLRSAEETATDTVNRAEVHAADLLERARDEVAQAEDQARGAVCRGEEQARRLEAAARAEAAEIIAEAEARASARTRQIEQWAEQVVSHTRAEEARMLAEQREKRDQALAELRALGDKRDQVAGNITELRSVLGQALGLVGPPLDLPPARATQTPGPAPEAELEDEARSDQSAGTDEPEPAPSDAMPAQGPAGVTEAPEAWADEPVEDELGQDDEEMPWPAAFRPTGDAGDVGEEEVVDLTGELELPAGARDTERDEFDTKFDAWVTATEEPHNISNL
jgi:DivIVA domain-containing protein